MTRILLGVSASVALYKACDLASRLTQDGDEVRSAAYLHAVHGYIGIDGEMRFFDLGGEYNDRLVETSAGWRISERVLKRKWIRGSIPKKA